MKKFFREAFCAQGLGMASVLIASKKKGIHPEKKNREDLT